jgi:hypothetical protein
MSQSRARLISFVAALCLAVPYASSALEPKTLESMEQSLAGTCAAPFPDGFGWPADPIGLWKISGGVNRPSLNIPGKIDTPAQRRHGWSMFSGITQPAGASGSPPVFHTWYTVEEAFDASAGKVSCSERRPSIQLSLPTQLILELNAPLRATLRKNDIEVLPRFDPRELRLPTQLQADSAHGDVVAFSHVAFNQEMYDYIRDNKYYSKATLDKFIDPAQARKAIVEPPVRGISLKFSWWPAAPDRLTPVPVWDFDPRFPGDAKNKPTSWKRVVMVDPVGGLPPPASVTLDGFVHDNPSVVGLDHFYAVQLSAADATLAMSDFRLKGAAKTVLGRSLQEGDYMLLTAMHIATREFDPWVFLTYWWTDQPGVGPLASDMPNSVTGVWRNYVMDVSYNINKPKTSSGQAPIAYNPWLELFQLGGTRSQCMACHARSAYGPEVEASFNPIDMSTLDPNGFEATPTNPDDPNFKPGTLSLQRIWTILTRAH